MANPIDGTIFPQSAEVSPEVLRARAAAAARAAGTAPAGPAAAAAPAAEAAAPAATRTGGWFRRTAGATSDFVKGAGNTLRAAPSAMLEGDLGAAALRTGSALKGAAGGIAQSSLAKAALPLGVAMSANDSRGTDTDAYSQRTGIARGDGQSPMLDAAKDVGIRGLGVMQDVGNTLTMGVADRVGNLIAGNGFKRSAGNQVGEMGAPGAEVSQLRPAPTAAPTATPASAEPNVAGYSNEGRGKGPTGRPATAASLADPNGAIYRDGNSFSGKDVKFGAGVYNPDGSVRPSGGLIRNQDITNPDGSVTKSTLRGEGTVTSMDTTEGHRQNLLELQRNAAERANAPPMGGATGIGARGTSMMDDLVAKHNASKGPDVAGLSPFDRAQMQASLRQSQEGNANARTIAEMNNSTAQAGQASAQSIAAMHDATQRRSNDQNNATSLRGQDLSLAGHMAPLQYQQGRMALAGKYMQAAGGDPAKAQALAMADGAHDVAGNFSKNVEALQGQASSTQKIAKEQHEGARALFNGRGGSLIDPSLTGDAKASALKAAEDEAHNFAVQTVPGWNQLPIEQREKLMPKVLGLHELHQKTKNPDHAGNLAWARSLTSSQDNVEPSTGLREKGFYKGGQIGSRYGVIGGALTKDYEAGDVDFTPGGGKNSLRIAKPSAEALDALRKMTQGKDPLAD